MNDFSLYLFRPNCWERRLSSFTSCDRILGQILHKVQVLDFLGKVWRVSALIKR